jgi:hypothetical protein
LAIYVSLIDDRCCGDVPVLTRVAELTGYFTNRLLVHLNLNGSGGSCYCSQVALGDEDVLLNLDRIFYFSSKRDFDLTCGQSDFDRILPHKEMEGLSLNWACNNGIRNHHCIYLTRVLNIFVGMNQTAN